MSVEQRITERRIALPSGSAPATNYVNAVRSGLPVILKAVVEVAG